MTTSIALVRSDMKNAITLHAPPSPIPEEPAVKIGHAVSYWDPWHELGLYDPIQNMMPCMGRMPSEGGAPCRSEAPIDKSADLKCVLVSIAAKTPQDVSEHDLNQLLDLGTCNAHQNDVPEVRNQGLKALHYRLNIATMHYERLERYIDEIRKLRIYVQQLQSSAAPHNSSLEPTHHDRMTMELRMRIGQLEQENVLARMETERIEADSIDREAKMDRDVQERDEKIEDLIQKLVDVEEQHKTHHAGLTQQVHDKECVITTLEEQSKTQSSQVEQLRGELETRKANSWRRKLRRWFTRKEP